MRPHHVRAVPHDGDQETIPAGTRPSGNSPRHLTLRVTGDDFSATYTLDLGRSLLVGRLRDADVCIEHGEVSRRHLLLHTGPPLRVEDLGSSNGTIIQGERLSPRQPVELSAGDLVRVGSLVLLFRWDDARAEGDGRPSPAGRSPAMVKLYELVDRVAPARINVLIHGETGAGKEVLAEAIHARSTRADKPFVKLNCGGFSETLLESELFGHEKGAFTGAVQSKPGLLESAEGGTVLLDEIGELPMSLQVKFLRVLEERKVRRVGGLTARPIDVRIVAATHRDLEGDVARGTFRQDLFFRLNSMTLVIPPLRERVEEIGPLAEMFLEQMCAHEGRGRRLIMSPEARQLLLRHRWPGNVRELRNVMERAALFCRGNVITREELPVERMEAGVDAVVAGDPGGDRSVRAGPQPSERAATIPPPAAQSSPGVPPPPPSWGSGSFTSVPGVPPPPPSWTSRGKVNEAERQAIVDALEQCAGNQTKAAALLGISRGTLLARLALYGLPRPRSSRRSGGEPEE
jgi:two-component system, NtrC family, response regulator AtoC